MTTTPTPERVTTCSTCEHFDSCPRHPRLSTAEAVLALAEEVRATMARIEAKIAEHYDQLDARLSALEALADQPIPFALGDAK